MLIFALLAGAAAFAGAALIAARAPRWLSTRSTAVTVVAAVALGCAALAVGGAPTGSAGVDGLMRFGFVAATTLAARYAPRQMVALSTAIAVVASLNSPRSEERRV